MTSHCLRHILSIIVLAFIISDAEAVVINVDERNLSIELKKISCSDREIILEGHASDADLNLLRTIGDSIKVLDIRNLNLPDNKLPDYMLFKTGVSTVVLPDGLESIGDWCFAESAMREVVLPASVGKIGDGAFYRCGQLSLLDFSKCGVSTIPDNFCYGCVSLTEVMLPETLNKIGRNAFRRCALKSINIETVAEIDDYAFAEMSSLTSICLKGGVKSGDGVFFGDKALDAVSGYLLEATPLILAGTSIENVERSYSGDKIGEGAFADMHVEVLYINPGVREIGAYAFRNMSGLREVNVMSLGSEVPVTSNDAFSGVDTSVISLHIASDTFDIWKSHPVWGNFMIKDPAETSADEVLCDKSLHVSVRFEGGILEIIANSGIDSLGVYDQTGMLIGNYYPESNIFRTRVDSDADVLIVGVVSGNERIIKKIRRK